jgi:hypothetical protein
MGAVRSRGVRLVGALVGVGAGRFGANSPPQPRGAPVSGTQSWDKDRTQGDQGSVTSTTAHIRSRRIARGT